MEEPAAWGAAQTACEQQGGNLASVDMSYDQAFIAGAVLQGKTDAWIGLRRKVPLGREGKGWCSEVSDLSSVRSNKTTH